MRAALAKFTVPAVLYVVLGVLVVIPIVMILVYITTPDYISLLWTHPTGQLMLVGCVVWMSMGILVMKKMINFDF